MRILVPISLALTLVTIISSCNSEKTENNFEINGTVSGLKDGTLYFTYEKNGTPQMDTVSVCDGKFVYSGFVTEPTPIYLIPSLLRTSNKPPALLFVEPKKMSMNLDLNNLEMTVLNNSKSHEDYLEYKKGDRKFQLQADTIYQIVEMNKDNEKVLKALQKKYLEVDSMESEFVKSFVSSHRGSYVSSYLISGKFLSAGNFEDAQKLYSMLEAPVQNSVMGKQIANVISSVAKTAIGSQAPDFVQEDIQGNKIKLSSLKGKYILLDFWASWCSPCRKENPNVVKVYNKFKNKNFEIIAVSLDKNKDQWQKAIKSDGLLWKHVSDLQGWENSVARSYGVQSIPDNFLIDPQGKIIAKGLRGEELNKTLSQILK